MYFFKARFSSRQIFVSIKKNFEAYFILLKTIEDIESRFGMSKGIASNNLF